MATLIDTYNEIKRENENLRRRVDDLQNEKNGITSDPYYQRAMGFRVRAKKTMLYKAYKYLRYGKLKEGAEGSLEGGAEGNLKGSLKEGAGESAQESQKEFHYGYMLNAYEYRFLRYKRSRNAGCQLDLKSIRIPCVPGLVSVILPVYNGEDYVEASIESVLMQGYGNMELIIVDDGSTDRTPKIVDQYAALDPRVRAIHQKNQKLPRALSEGFRVAKGEYFTWTSADNIMHPGFLERFVSDLQRYGHTCMVYGNLRLMDENGDPKTDFAWYQEEGRPPEHAMLPKCCLELNTYANNYIGAAFMYRAVAANVIGDYSAYKFGIEDYDYWMKVNELFVLRHASFEEPEYSYRLHPKSLTSKDKELKITENRFKQMLWDECRRDYFQKDIVWIILCEGESHPQYLELVGAIQRQKQKFLCLEQAGQQTENPYERFVCVCFGQPGQGQAAQIPPNAFKALVTEGPQPVDNPAMWDACICRGDVGPADRLENYRGWFGISDGQTLFAFLDSKAKSRFLYHLEGEAASKSTYKSTYGPNFSIVISYHGDDMQLQRCLKSIEEGGAEIIITGSCGEIRLCQEKYGSQYGYVANISENDMVRKNAAAYCAHGKYLVFVEDTCAFAEGYFQNLYDIFSIGKQIATVFGNARVQLRQEGLSEAQLRLLGKYEIQRDDLYQYNDQDLPGGYSFAIRHDCFRLVGGFYNILEKGQDTEFCDRIFLGAAMALHNVGFYIYLSKECTVFCDPGKVGERQLETRQWLQSYSEYMLKINGILPYNVWPEVISQEVRHLEAQAAKNPDDSWAAANIRCSKRLLEIVRADFRDKEKVDLNRDLFSRLA